MTLPGASLTRLHHVWQCAHAVIELPAHLVPQVVTIVLLLPLHQEALRVRAQGVAAGGGVAAQALDRHQRRQQRLETVLRAARAHAAGAGNELGWPRRCKLARTFLWEASYKKAGVGPTSGPTRAYILT